LLVGCRCRNQGGSIKCLVNDPPYPSISIHIHPYPPFANRWWMRKKPAIYVKIEGTWLAKFSLVDDISVE
jgi:hypothetical protein